MTSCLCPNSNLLNWAWQEKAGAFWNEHPLLLLLCLCPRHNIRLHLVVSLRLQEWVMELTQLNLLAELVMAQRRVVTRVLRHDKFSWSLLAMVLLVMVRCDVLAVMT